MIHILRFQARIVRYTADRSPKVEVQTFKTEREAREFVMANDRGGLATYNQLLFTIYPVNDGYDVLLQSSDGSANNKLIASGADIDMLREYLADAIKELDVISNFHGKDSSWMWLRDYSITTFGGQEIIPEIEWVQAFNEHSPDVDVREFLNAYSKHINLNPTVKSSTVKLRHHMKMALTQPGAIILDV